MSEENVNKCRKCTYCGNYDRYYVKGLHHFESIRKGYCNKHCKIVANGDSCEYWKTASHKHYLRKRVASRALYEILMDISAIRQILQESQDEEEHL